MLLVVAPALLLSVFWYFNSSEELLLPVVSNLTTELEEVHLSTDLVPHQVYLDRRPGSSYFNATIVFISVHKQYRQDIIGCEIDEIQINQTKVVDLAILHYIKENFNVSHRDCYLFCYNANINENSKVSVLYSKNGTVSKEPVRSNKVIIPPSYSVEEDGVMVCATGFGVVPHLDQWLIYQKTIGVKFIHLNVHPSFLQNVQRSSTLKQFMQNGFVKMVVWKDYLNRDQVFYFSQSLKYHDCVLRYQGVIKYMMVIDFDEYFIPYSFNTSVHVYAKKLIAGFVGSVILPRLTYNTSKNFSEALIAKNGNRTHLYDTSVYKSGNDGKSINLIRSVDQNSVHTALMKSPYFNKYYFSPQITNCYIAHLVGMIEKYEV